MALLSEDQLEALQELLNIGMGQASAALAEMFDTFVHLEVPSVEFVLPDEVARRAEKLVGNEHIWAVRQGFHDAIKGEAVILFEPDASAALSKLLGVDSDDDISEGELLLEVTNIYIGACLSGIAGQLKKEIAFYPPVLSGTETSVEKIFRAEDLVWGQALLTQIVLKLDEYSIANNIMLFMPESSCVILGDMLDEFIESFE